MPDHPRYSCVFAEEVAEFIVSLPKSKQQRIIDLAKSLAAHPFRISDYRIRDESGREIENILIGNWVFSYWVDHPVKEVRITDLSEA